MILPVIICSHERQKLLQQTVESLKKNSKNELQIIIVDDSADGVTLDYIKGLKDVDYYHFKSASTIGQSKLRGYYMAKDSDYIYFSDDDVYFMPNWDQYLIEALKNYDDICIAGPRGVHGKRARRPLLDREVAETNLQTGYGMMFRRKEWDEYGHFPNYDEDSWIGYEMRSRTGKTIGVVDPPVIIHTGYKRKSSQADGTGGKTFDWEEMEEDMKRYKEIYFE